MNTHIITKDYTIRSTTRYGRPSIIETPNGNVYVWSYTGIADNHLTYGWVMLDTTSTIAYSLECQYNAALCTIRNLLSNPRNSAIAVGAALAIGIIVGITL